MEPYLRELNRIFRQAPDKHQAHERSGSVLQDMAADPTVLTAVFRHYLNSPAALNKKNYPVVGMNIRLNPDYHLVANCWIPLPDRKTDVSTKSIHHHGTMLLTTATALGPGYEHWLFTTPKELDPEKELYAMRVTDRKRHARGNVAFVDAYEPHLPLYPSDLTVTLALWSDRERTTWKDFLKRMPLLKNNETALKGWAQKFGLAKQWVLKVIQYFDFYPTSQAFKGIKERMEFGLGPNEDYLYSLFHVLQGTGNEALAPLIEEHLRSGQIPLVNAALIQKLLQDLRNGRAISGRLSAGHFDVPHANFTSGEIQNTVAALESREQPCRPIPSPDVS